MATKTSKKKRSTKKTDKAVVKKPVKEENAKTVRVKESILTVVYIVAAILVLMSLVSDSMGIIGGFCSTVLNGLFGKTAISVPIMLGYIGIMYFLSRENKRNEIIFALLFVVFLAAFSGAVGFDYKTEFVSDNLGDNFKTLWTVPETGGIIGGIIAWPLKSLLNIGAAIILGGAGICVFIYLFRITFKVITKEDIKKKKEKIDTKIENRNLKKQLKENQKYTEKLEKEKEQAQKQTDLLMNTEAEKKKTVPVEIPDNADSINDSEELESILNEIENQYKQKAPSRKMKKSRTYENARDVKRQDVLINVTENTAPAKSETKPKTESYNSILDELNLVKTKPTEEVAEETGSDQHFDLPDVTEHVQPDKQEIQEPVPEKENNPIADDPEENVVTISDYVPEKNSSPSKPVTTFERTVTAETESKTNEEISGDEVLSGATVNIAESVTPIKNVPREFSQPPISLLTYTPDNNAALYREELRQNAARLIEILSSFNVEARVLDAKRGPTVTRYELQPSDGVRTSKFTNLSDDIALHLAAPSVRIEAPIPGKSAIGIEVPNKTTSTVYLKEIIGSNEFLESKSKISVALGKDISGLPIVIDLAKMPHLLIAGSTGSGKSVCINSILMSILYKSTPDEVKLLLVDPKVVELNVYNGIPNLLIPVVTDATKAAGALNWAVSEMLNRYQLFAESNVREFNGYNNSLPEGQKKLPQIVIIIDELADLMMASPKDVEDAICRLAQMARAAGMHLVVATQRPSADIITGIIRSNVPSRIAFAVSTATDSRIILDTAGADKLVGKGDMLYSPLGATKPMRVQGCFVSDKEVEAVIDYIKKHSQCEYDDEVIKKIEDNINNMANQKNGKGNAAAADSQDDDEDDKLMDAIGCVVDFGQASTSMLQRRLGLGYPRASKLIDEMEERGIVGPPQGSKPREVLISKQEWLEMKARREL